MLNKILKRLEDSSGRLNIPKDLLDFVGIKPNEKIALCECGEGIKAKPLHTLQDCKVIAIVRMDNKGRFVFPNQLLKDGKNEMFFEIYVLNGDLILQEVEV